MNRNILHALTLVGVAFAIVLLSLCSGCKRKGQNPGMTEADSIAFAKAQQDSIAKALADSMQAVQNSEQAQREREALEAQRERERFKFHVISGSFRYQDNANSYLSLIHISEPTRPLF